MDRKSQALALNDFVSRYTNMWNDEIMNEYPESMQHYPREWIELLIPMSNEELFAIDTKNITHPIFSKIENTSLDNFIKEGLRLSRLPAKKLDHPVKFEQWAYNGIKAKKRHEIDRIIPALKNLKEKIKFNQVIDIGGGVGHLSRVIAHYANINAISIDRNHEFQKIGKERLSKYRKLPDAKEVHFVNLNFSPTNSAEELKSIFKSDSLSLGLHTCGALANILIKTSCQFNLAGLLSFGCCYHHLNPKLDFPISNFYKERNFAQLNLFAFSLATRSHAQDDFEVFKTKRQVKNYRYALHLFLMRKFNNKYFQDVGECDVKIYWMPFHHYLKLKLNELKLENTFTNDEIEDFYHCAQTQKELNEMFVGNLIRWLLGRSLEVYILLDRAMYLEENGYEVFVEEYFKEALSPRNIGILALRSN